MFHFKHPFTMCVAGCTGSGKSKWVAVGMEASSSGDGIRNAGSTCLGRVNSGPSFQASVATDASPNTSALSQIARFI